MCGRVSLTKQIGYKIKILKVRLRFMFHYCLSPIRHPNLWAIPCALRHQESAAFGRNKNRTLADKVSFTLTALKARARCGEVTQSAAK